ncbi:MAG: cytochrome P450 [Chloroflexi bacterium]|nr:cytochrome P450 [Chloroflexota bacterium]MCI0855475.1 cytochrome P450 [Chloroflexota bacterium]MCI0889252.1 cytochrome P450 [Chloroflexota bacterium]
MTTETEYEGVFGAEAGSDPYESYERMRREAPVSRLGDTFWAVAKFEDVDMILRDWETFSSIVGAKAISGEEPASGMIFNDPPIHTRLRGLIQKAFTPRVVELQRPGIQAYCEELVEKMLAQEDPDLVASLAYPLPVMVIANMLGVADGDMATFKRWSDVIIQNIGPALLNGDDSGVSETNVEFEAYFGERLEQLRREPDESLLSELVHVETEEGKLTREDLLMFCVLLLVAGNETTTGLIINSMRAFSEFPDALQQVKQDPDLIPAAVEEALRYYAPFQATIRRATKDLELRGQKIAKDDRILVLLASANRDEDVFEHPKEFRLDRTSNRHVAFGFGIHFCVGAPLARLEGGIALNILLPKIRSVAILDDDAGEMLLPGGPKSLRVHFELE